MGFISQHPVIKKNVGCTRIQSMTDGSVYAVRRTITICWFVVRVITSGFHDLKGSPSALVLP
jgi:hypothetical protein